MPMTRIVSITHTRKVFDPNHRYWTEELCIGGAAVRGDLHSHKKRSQRREYALDVDQLTVVAFCVIGRRTAYETRF